ncbi:helix-turn-helix domain-containing protein [Myroides sp. ZB35]|uniref:helix-turn-helix domain-containing protein n=1 Tax=Myroides sp. ZB35 TaxID=1458492 RepID=UPI001E45C2A7|nr:helix-turn-helix domain-containing protein [Myroides sp. ZB35]
MNLHKVGDYAALLNVTTNVLNKRITEGCGISPSCVIVNRLILQAKRLLAYSDLSVKEIAFSLGYEDVSYFNRYFKIQTSYTPLTFRRNQELSKRPY